MSFTRLCVPTALLALMMSPAWGADLLEVYRLALQNDPVLLEADANRMAVLRPVRKREPRCCRRLP